MIAPYVLTALMLKPARLIYLSSSMHRGGSAGFVTDWHRGTASYSDTKLWVTALSQAFAPTAGVDTVSHPWIPAWAPSLMGGSGCAPMTSSEGRRTQIWLATASQDRTRLLVAIGTTVAPKSRSRLRRIPTSRID